MPHDSGSRVETLTIQPVPESQRTGKVRHLFSFWFTVQIIPLAVVTGLLGPTIYKLDVASTVIATILGSLVGAVFMALHSVQCFLDAVSLRVERHVCTGEKRCDDKVFVAGVQQ